MTKSKLINLKVGEKEFECHIVSMHSDNKFMEIEILFSTLVRDEEIKDNIVPGNQGFKVIVPKEIGEPIWEEFAKEMKTSEKNDNKN